MRLVVNSQMVRTLNSEIVHLVGYNIAISITTVHGIGNVKIKSDYPDLASAASLNLLFVTEIGNYK
jgi:hypothetical protein